MKKVFVLDFMMLSVFANAQNISTSIDELKTVLQNKYPSHGLSIGIIKDDSTYFVNIGTTASGSSINENTVFEIGSLTKTFTGLLLGIEIEKKVVSQNSWIDNYLPPNCKLNPALRHRIKLTDIASHQSGLPNFNDDKYIEELFEKDPVQPFKSVDEQYLCTVLQDTDSLADYGTYRYSNYGFAMLGELLQNITHTAYSKLLEKNILQPMNLTHTNLKMQSNVIRAGLYDDKGNVKPPIIVNAMAPAGGLYSDTYDMVRYLKFQISPSANALGSAIILSQQTFYADSNQAVGLGWEMQKGYIEKTGDTWGNSSVLFFSPQQHTGVVILSDHRNSQLVQDVAEKILSEISKK